MSLFYLLLIHLAISTEEQFAIAFLVKKQMHLAVDQVLYDLQNNSQGLEKIADGKKGQINFRQLELRNKKTYRIVYVLITFTWGLYGVLLVFFY